jgi:hypothetical protein
MFLHEHAVISALIHAYLMLHVFSTAAQSSYGTVLLREQQAVQASHNLLQ